MADEDEGLVTIREYSVPMEADWAQNIRLLAIWCGCLSGIGGALWKVPRLMEKPLAFPQALGKPVGGRFQGGPGFPHLPQGLLLARGKEE